MESLDIYSFGILFVFIVGYAMITLEHFTKIDKATVALLTGILCWVILFSSSKGLCKDGVHCLNDHISNIAQVVFFLLGALAIVELINIHKGFALISNRLKVQSKRKLLWVISILTFFLSAILDNLTTTIVMITLIQKLIEPSEDRLLIGGAIVIAANSGGAWTPIGDVTTTMLWIGGEVTTLPIMRHLFLPSLGSLIVAIGCLSFMLKGDFKESQTKVPDLETEPMGNVIFFLGLGVLILVPIFKVLTGLPPFMGVLFGLSILWIVSDFFHSSHQDRQHLRMGNVFTRLEISSLLFFLGILLAIDALDSAGMLHSLAEWLSTHVGNITIIATLIGLASAIVDNVPLVAGTMGMYSMSDYPPDHSLWELIAYCAGTGGSILIIGSAAGVVFMGLEKVDFFWYFKRISFSAAVGYFAGIIIYLL